MLINIFLQYFECSEDRVHLDEIERNLRILSRHYEEDCKHRIVFFSRKLIKPGDHVEDILKPEIEKSHIFLPLVSSTFLDGVDENESLRKEFRRIVKKHEQKEASVLPIILRPCIFEFSLFKKLKPLPENEIPITKHDNADDAYVSIARSIKKKIDDVIQDYEADQQSHSNIVKLNSSKNTDRNNKLLFKKIMERIDTSKIRIITQAI